MKSGNSIFAVLAEALENVEFYKSIGNMEFASNEQNRANLLQRQLEMLNK